jgi:hypothetical protein
MALGAIGVAGGGQADGAAMVGVAGGARWSEHLLGVVHCSVMACAALLIANLIAEKSKLCQVAGRALFRKHCVCRGESAG